MKSPGKTGLIALDLLVRALGGHAVALCQIAIEDYFLVADEQN